MQEQIKKIELVLENCECVNIEGKYIGHLSMENIKRSINRVASNAIFDMSICGHFSISINRKAEYDESSGEELFDGFGKQSPLERLLNYPDITSVYIHFSDGKTEQFYVEWDGGECDNDNQKTYMNEFGDLFIVIDKELKLEDVFDVEEIEDEKHMDFIWSIYS